MYDSRAKLQLGSIGRSANGMALYVHPVDMAVGLKPTALDSLSASLT